VIDMLVYNNGRFYAGKSSFALPNGSRINTDLELVHKCGFGIYPPSGNSYCITILVSGSSNYTDRQLEN
jgi:hypothetical protein